MLAIEITTKPSFGVFPNNMLVPAPCATGNAVVVVDLVVVEVVDVEVVTGVVVVVVSSIEVMVIESLTVVVAAVVEVVTSINQKNTRERI